MVGGWTRVCPDCGNDDGTKVERIAFRPTFRCECGYVWDGSGATFIGLWSVEPDASDKDQRALADRIFEAMQRAASERAPRERS